MRRAILLTACLLAAAPGLAAEPEHFFGSPSDYPNTMPKSYLRVEVFNHGVDYPTVITTRLAKVCWRTGSFGAGLTLFESYLGWFPLEYNPFLVLNADYVILRDVRRTGPFYSTPFELSVQAAGSFLNAPFIRTNACMNVGYWGVGLGLEAGFISLTPQFITKGSLYPYAALYVRLLTFDIGL